MILYTGSAGYAGVDEIVYEVTDAKGEVEVAPVVWTVPRGF